LVSVTGVVFSGVKLKFVLPQRGSVRGSVIKVGSRQAGIPIGNPNPGVKIRDLGGQFGRFQANHAVFVVHDG
jgi:hypothetical protein